MKGRKREGLQYLKRYGCVIYNTGTRLHIKTTEKKSTLPAHHHSPGSFTLCNQPAAFFKLLNLTGRHHGPDGTGHLERCPPPPPPNFTHCLHNELHCSIVDGIACRHCSSRKSHFCCLKKCRPPSQNIFLRLCSTSIL